MGQRAVRDTAAYRVRYLFWLSHNIGWQNLVINILDKQ